MNYVVYIFKSTRGAGGGGGYIENMKKIFPLFLSDWNLPYFFLSNIYNFFHKSFFDLDTFDVM